MNALGTTRTAYVAPGDCDLDDRTYWVPCFAPLNPLVRSIECMGIVNPPVVQERTDGPLIPVVGRRRLMAAARLGVSEVEVRVLPPDIPEGYCFRLAFWDNVSCRVWNIAVTAVVIRRLLELFPVESVADEFLPVLGVPPKGPRLERIRTLGGLEPPVLEALASGRILEKTALILARTTSQERIALLELTERLGLNANKKAEFVEHVVDLSVYHGTPLLGFLDDPAVKAIVEDDRSPAVQRGETLRTLLRRRKFPELVAREDEFHEWLREHGNVPGVTIRPTPGFEGPECTVEVRVDSQEEAAALIALVQKRV